MIYQCAHTSWATKRNCGAFWLFAATNNLLWKQKESWEDWRTLPEDSFPFQQCVSFAGYIYNITTRIFVGFVLPPIKNDYVNSHQHSSSKKGRNVFFFLSGYNWGPVNSTASCKPVLPFSLKWCLAVMSGSQRGASPDGMSCRSSFFTLTASQQWSGAVMMKLHKP